MNVEVFTPVSFVDAQEAAEEISIDLGAFASMFAAIDGDENTTTMSTDSGSEEIDSFDSETTLTENVVIPSLFVTLLNDSEEVVSTYEKKVTAASFALGSSLTTSFFSSLSSIAGACGPLCFHSLTALTQSTGSISSGVSSLGVPGFTVDSLGNFHLNGNASSLSSLLGVSPENLLKGEFILEDLFNALAETFGYSFHILGFGIFECILDALIPTP